MVKLIKYEINYSLYQIRLYWSNGNSDIIQMTAKTGKKFWRYKLGRFNTIPHPCIFLGYCPRTRKELVIHNHQDQGRAFVDTFQGFARKQAVYKDSVPCTNTPLVSIRKALNSVLSRKKYNLLTYNCQNMANSACKNTSTSGTVQKVLLGTLVIGITAAIIRA